MQDHESTDKTQAGDGKLKNIQHIEDLYKSWFLDYASYVILDRAVPNIDDGLKPVQRRILHSLYELEDGRYNKAANVIGHTMRYHPHGDMAIGDALIKLGQKELLIDTQGNWGNPLTGDRAAAPRYIEARLSDFAKEVLFNPLTTEWLPSYDGRNKEPLTLPVKFPLLLVLGTEGIAVGLSTRILPHNFVEVIKASISQLKGRKQKIFPDFISGGSADFTEYNDGMRGGKVRVRAVIDKVDARTLRIRELPFGITTSSLIESIVAANEKGTIKIKRIEDNTAAEVDIQIELPIGVSPDLTIDGLYAFTDCEVSIAANCCIIKDDRPVFIGVSDLLDASVAQTTELLKTELTILLNQLKEKIHLASLEKVFIEQKIYRKIENCTSWEDILTTIEKGLKPFRSEFIRDVTDADLNKLTEIKIKRISKFDSEIAEEALVKLKGQVKEVEYDLLNLIPYAIRYYERLLEKYGKGRERRTVKAEFETIHAASVSSATIKFYVDRKEGFVGSSLKKDELVGECTEFDEIIGISRAGEFRVAKIADKVFFAKDLIHVETFRRNDDRKVYHMIYRDGLRGPVYAKRFVIGGITRDKEYNLTKGTKGTRVLYLSVNPNGEGEIVNLNLKTKTSKTKALEIDFGAMEIKARAVKGQLVTEESVDDIEQLEKGESTLAATKVWFDQKTGHLNQSEQGNYLGEFKGDELLLTLYKDGAYELIPFNLAHYFGTNVDTLMTFSDQVVSVIFYEAERDDVYVKRFAIDKALTGKRIEFIPQATGTKVLVVSTDPSPLVKVSFKKVGQKLPPPELVRVSDFIDIKGVKALGNKLSKHKVKDVALL